MGSPGCRQWYGSDESTGPSIVPVSANVDRLDDGRRPVPRAFADWPSGWPLAGPPGARGRILWVLADLFRGWTRAEATSSALPLCAARAGGPAQRALTDRSHEGSASVHKGRSSVGRGRYCDASAGERQGFWGPFRSAVVGVGGAGWLVLVGAAVRWGAAACPWCGGAGAGVLLWRGPVRGGAVGGLWRRGSGSRGLGWWCGRRLARWRGSLRYRWQPVGRGVAGVGTTSLISHRFPSQRTVISKVAFSM